MSDPIHDLYRVVAEPDLGGFRVRAGNGAAASALFDTHEAAVLAAKRLAEGHGWARIVVHAVDGSVEREFLYGRDHRERPVSGRAPFRASRPWDARPSAPERA
jgi:hypothetical protein